MNPGGKLIGMFEPQTNLGGGPGILWSLGKIHEEAGGSTPPPGTDQEGSGFDSPSPPPSSYSISGHSIFDHGLLPSKIFFGASQPTMEKPV